MEHSTGNRNPVVSQPSQDHPVIRHVEPSEWNSLLDGFSDATVFHRLEWLQTIQAVHGGKIVLASMGAPHSDQCLSVWPYIEIRKGPFRILGSPVPGWSTAYMGPLFADNVDIPSALMHWLNDSLFRRYVYAAVRVIDRHHPVDLQAHGFNAVTKFDTYLIDLSQSEEDIFANFKSECRTRIRKAEKLGLTVAQETTADFIDDFWRMSIETFARAGIQPTHNRAFVEQLWSRFQSSGDIRVLSAMKDGKRIGTLVLPFDRHTMYYWAGAAFTEHRDLPSHNLLHWEAMREGKRLGLREYDFIATRGGPGRFKKTFGPREAFVSTYWERSSSRLMAALKSRYEKYLRSRRRVDVGEQ